MSEETELSKTEAPPPIAAAASGSPVVRAKPVTYAGLVDLDGGAIDVTVTTTLTGRKAIEQLMLEEAALKWDIGRAHVVRYDAIDGVISEMAAPTTSRTNTEPPYSGNRHPQLVGALEGFLREAGDDLYEAWADKEWQDRYLEIAESIVCKLNGEGIYLTDHQSQKPLAKEPLKIGSDQRLVGLSKCCSCGHEWTTGTNGSHSCIDTLKRRASKGLAMLKSGDGSPKIVIEFRDLRECQECYETLVRLWGGEYTVPNAAVVAKSIGATAVDAVEDSRLPDINLVLGDKFADWGSTFGCTEFEGMAMAVVDFLRSETPSKHHLLNMRGPTGEYAYERGEGWTKRFAIEDIGDYAIFAAMCAAGYFRHAWFPKWCFTVTDEFIARCPLACYQTRFSRDPKSGGCPNSRNNYPEGAKVEGPADSATPNQSQPA